MLKIVYYTDKPLEIAYVSGCVAIVYVSACK